MGEIDAHYRAIVAGMPPALRAPAERLPFDLGLVAAEDDGWEAFVKLEPNRDLPSFAVDDAPLTYRAAHWAAGFHGCLADRIADGQTPPSPALEALRAELLAAFRASLADAVGDAAAADEAVDDVLRAFDRGVALEQQAFARGALDIDGYGELVREKSAWVRVAALALLERGPDPDRAAAFRVAAELLMMALQCADDAADRDEDRAQRGASFPALVDLPPGVLFRAAPKLTRAAGVVAHAGGFVRFAEWLSHRADDLDRLSVPDEPLRAEVGSVALAASLVERWPGTRRAWFERSGSWLHPFSSRAGTSACRCA